MTSDAYVDSLGDLLKSGTRVWLIGLADMPDEFATLPADWHSVSEKKAGGVRARLFVHQ